MGEEKQISIYDLMQSYYAGSGAERLYFELCYGEESGDDAFRLICLEILQKLLREYHCVTVFDRIDKEYLDCGAPKKKHAPILSGALYHDLLSAYGVPVEVLYEGNDIITITNGADMGGIKFYLQMGTGRFAVGHFQVFAYRNNPPKGGFQQVKKMLREELCDLFLSYEEIRDSFMISVPAGENPDVFVDLITNTCQAFGKEIRFFRL